MRGLGLRGRGAERDGVDIGASIVRTGSSAYILRVESSL